jgi:hypothetical protein
VNVSKRIINYNDTSTISLYNFKNFQVLSEPNDLSLNIKKINNNYTLITVKPKTTTRYIIYGLDYNNNIAEFDENIQVNIALNYNNVFYYKQIIINVQYNSINTINLFGAYSYQITPNTFLTTSTQNALNDTITIQPLTSINYKIVGTDYFSNNSTIYISVIVQYDFIFSPAEPTIYEGNKIEISAVQIGSKTSTLNYVWIPTTSKYLSPEQAGIKYGQNITLISYKSLEFIVDGFINDELVATNNIKINVIPKPSSVIDVDILPISLYTAIMSRNSKQLKELLIKDPILSKKIINFYYTTLQTAYRLEWTNKNGGNTLINWYSVYQQMNDTSPMILTFYQQWNFFQYIQLHQTRKNITPSNFAFLLNNVNQIYLEHPQQIYIINN